MSDYLAALETERTGYVARGLDDRVAQVDAEIKRVKAADRKTAKTPDAPTPAPASVKD